VTSWINATDERWSRDCEVLETSKTGWAVTSSMVRIWVSRSGPPVSQIYKWPDIVTG